MQPTGPASDAIDGTWVGTIITEGDVTTVANASGSVWGGTARLVEEASIGVESGAPPYMLGEVRGVVASSDRIYVLDSQIPTVHVYDLAGGHVMDIGGPGDGPGEFRNSDYLAIGPDEALYVRSGRQGRLTIFEPDGQVRDTWPLAGGRTTDRPTVITRTGSVFMPGFVNRTEDVTSRRSAMIPWGPDGAEGEVIEEPVFDVEDYRLVARGDGPTLGRQVPFAPRVVWALAPSGAVIAGVSEDYSFEIRQAGGGVIEVHKT